MTALGHAKGDQESREKRERKGKGPRFIPAVLQDQNSEEEDEEDQDQQGAMDLDENLDQAAANFLITLDEKGIAVYVSPLLPPALFSSLSNLDRELPSSLVIERRNLPRSVEKERSKSLYPNLPS